MPHCDRIDPRRGRPHRSGERGPPRRRGDLRGVPPVTGLVLVTIDLPDLPEVDRLRVAERARVTLLVIEARYVAEGYVFAPVFSPEG